MSRRRQGPSEPREDGYVPPGPQLRAFDHGVGTLKVDGVLHGHLASVVGEITFPSRSPWPWFGIVWTDGTQEPAFEDDGPGWLTVNQLEAGLLDHYGPSIKRERRRLFCKTIHYTQAGPRRVFEFSWLSNDDAEAMWRELGLDDSDF